MKLIGVLFILPIFVIGQTTFSGTVVNKKTKEKIPYVTVGLIKENIGINANEDGFFVLESYHRKNEDTLIFSCVGYDIFKVAVNSTKTSGINVTLTETLNELANVIISNKKEWLSTTLNDFKNCGNFFLTTSGYMTQQAEQFEGPVENAILTSIKICKSGDFLFPEKAIFRIRVYECDTLTGKPAKDLCTDVIEVKAKREIVEIDVTKYKIRIPGKRFFVAIEWLRIAYNKYTYTTKQDGKKVKRFHYKPLIGYVNITGPILDSWMLNYQNIWVKTSGSKRRSNLAIAATIKY